MNGYVLDSVLQSIMLSLVNTMQITYRIWIGISAIVVLAASVAGAIHIWKQSHTDSEIAAIAPLDPSCDLQQNACQGVFADGSRITLSINPRPFQPLRPLRIQVRAQGMDPQTVEVDFSGLGMYMGYNRPRLQKESPGQYSGPGMLASCALERMVWEATVLATTDEGVMAAPFRFETFRP